MLYIILTYEKMNSLHPLEEIDRSIKDKGIKQAGLLLFGSAIVPRIIT